MDIPFDSKKDTAVESPAISPPWESVMIWLSLDTVMAGSFGGSGVTLELVWPCPSELGKAQFILRNEEEVKLWHLLKDRGLSMEFDLALTKVKLKEALDRVELINQAMTIDLPCIVEVSFLCSWCCL